MKSKTAYLCKAALIAALYCALTFVSASVGLSNGFIQLRLSEALCILPFFTPAAIPGLFVGCLLSNILTGALLPDILLGTAATVVSAMAASKIKFKFAVCVPNIILNTLIIPPVIYVYYGAEKTLPLIYLSIFVSELICSGVIGNLLLMLLQKLERYGIKL